MSIKLNTVLTTRKGEPLRERDQTTGQDADVQLRDALLTALDAALPGDENTDRKTKTRMYKLGQAIALEETFNPTAEEVTILLDRAARIFPAMVYGQVEKLLDPAAFDAA